MSEMGGAGAFSKFLNLNLLKLHAKSDKKLIFPSIKFEYQPKFKKNFAAQITKFK